MLLKITRKISDLKSEMLSNGLSVENQLKVDVEVNRLQSIKELDHTVVGNHICNTMISIGNKESVLEMSTCVELLLKQSRIIQTIQEIEQSILTAVNKNNALRAEEQSRDAKKKAKGLLAERKIEQVVLYVHAAQYLLSRAERSNQGGVFGFIGGGQRRGVSEESEQEQGGRQDAAAEEHAQQAEPRGQQEGLLRCRPARPLHVHVRTGQAATKQR